MAQSKLKDGGDHFINLVGLGLKKHKRQRSILTLKFLSRANRAQK